MCFFDWYTVYAFLEFEYVRLLIISMLSWNLNRLGYLLTYKVSFKNSQITEVIIIILLSGWIIASYS